MSIRNYIQTKAIKVNKIQSFGIVEEEHIYILPDDEIEENKLWEEKTKREKSSSHRNSQLSREQF